MGYHDIDEDRWKYSSGLSIISLPNLSRSGYTYAARGGKHYVK